MNPVLTEDLPVSPKGQNRGKKRKRKKQQGYKEKEEKRRIKKNVIYYLSVFSGIQAIPGLLSAALRDLA